MRCMPINADINSTRYAATSAVWPDVRPCYTLSVLQTTIPTPAMTDAASDRNQHLTAGRRNQPWSKGVIDLYNA